MTLAELSDRYAGNATAHVVEIDLAGSRRVISHADLHALARSRADRLAAAGVGPRHVIGIKSKNSIDWIAWDLAALMAGALVKALPDETQIADQAQFLARHGLALLVTDDPGPRHPCVLPPDGVPKRASAARPAPQVTDDRVHSLVYSSGTSGKLKGLNISTAGTEYVINLFMQHFPVSSADRHVIFLPLSNYQQRLSLYCCLWLGADLVLTPFQRVFQAIKSERPTFLIGPPVFYDTALQMYTRSGAAGSLNDFLGGEIRFLITGMAPIRRQTLLAYEQQGVPLLEAYGMTETGMIAWNTLEHHRIGSVGRLIDPAAVTRLPDGELLIRRASPLSSGYFETNGEIAEDTFRPDGTIVTGDYGELDGQGYLTLVGRKKDLIALGNGRKIHPAQVEGAFAEVEGLAEIVVVSTPDGGRLGGIITTTAPEDQDLRTRVRKQVEEVNRKLEPSQRVGPLVFSDQPLRANQRFMTANMKLSRPRAAEYFAEAVRQGP